MGVHVPDECRRNSVIQTTTNHCVVGVLQLLAELRDASFAAFNAFDWGSRHG
jgi:hypothetical protein